MRKSPGIEPGTHCWESSALTAMSTLFSHSCWNVNVWVTKSKVGLSLVTDFCNNFNGNHRHDHQYLTLVKDDFRPYQRKLFSHSAKKMCAITAKLDGKPPKRKKKNKKEWNERFRMGYSLKFREKLCNSSRNCMTFWVRFKVNPSFALLADGVCLRQTS